MAEGVKVELQSSWPDYVFHPEHKLMSLEKTRLFIKDNCHLPGVPSEKEGIDLAEMNGILLKKIEELTLHLIQQEEKLNALEKKLSQKK